jgi:hypothetical protein
MSLQNIEHVHIELQEVRVLIAAIALRQNSRIECLEQWAEREAANKLLKKAGILGKMCKDGQQENGFRMPFAPIRKRLARIQNYFASKLTKRQGYAKLAEEYSKEGKIDFNLILIIFFFISPELAKIAIMAGLQTPLDKQWSTED